MPSYLWFSVLIIFLGVFAFRQYKQYQEQIHNLEKGHLEAIQELKNEQQQTIENKELDHQQEKEAIEQDKENEIVLKEEQHKIVVEKYEKQVQELSDNLDAFSRNHGEVKTHQTLEDMKKEFIREGLINKNEMLILPNLFIPDTDNNSIRQIDHLILLPTGVYLIETKHWKGHIVHGLQRKNAGKLRFIPEMMNKTTTFVFVLRKIEQEDGTKEKTIQINDYGNPTNQASWSAAVAGRFLKTWVEPIVYFNYDDLSDQNYFHDLSDDTVNRFSKRSQLIDYFRSELKRKRKHTADKLFKMAEELEEANYRKHITVEKSLV